MIAPDDVAPQALAVRADARWPWLVLAAGAVIVAVGGFAFSAEDATPRPVGDQPASLAVPAAP